MNIEEKYYVNSEMTREIFDRLMSKLVHERDEILQSLFAGNGGEISNFFPEDLMKIIDFK